MKPLRVPNVVPPVPTLSLQFFGGDAVYQTAVRRLQEPVVAPADIPEALDLAMERYADGDDSAFADVYDRLAPRLYGFLLRRVRDKALAEDLTQQTFLRMHEARGRFVRGAAVSPWAFAIANRLMIDSMRSKKRDQSRVDANTDAGAALDYAASNDAGADEVLDAKRVEAVLARELSRLPEAHRTAYALTREDGLSMKEAADVLGTTVSAVKLRVHRAYLALREALGDRAPREGESV